MSSRSSTSSTSSRPARSSSSRAILYPQLFRTVLARMDPETAHRAVVAGLRAAHRIGAARMLEALTRPRPALRTEVLGISWPSPFGLAAGFDKAATAVVPLAALGFGHIEVGTVTAHAQSGNPRPRLFRLVDDRALINRMGFNNDGAAPVAARLKVLRRRLDRLRAQGRHTPVIGVNIGKTKATPLPDAVEDYALSARELAPVADYLVVNVSSPNTPGLRQLQDIESLRPLLTAVKTESEAASGKKVPLLVKIAPDLADEDVDAVADLVTDLGLDGVIATNTTITRDGLQTPAAVVEELGAGGLSGPVLAARSLQILVRMRARLPEDAAIISVGGVQNADDVAERIGLGADLVQGYSAFIYEGPFWASRINRRLRALN